MKILIISSNLIGDTILSTGVVNYFNKKFPKAKFTFLVGPSAGQVYENFPSKDKIILVNKKRFNLHWFYMYKKVCKTKWDIVIDFRSSLISHLLKKKKKFIFKKNKNLNQVDQLKSFFNINNFLLTIHTNNKEEIEIKHKINKNYKYVVLFPGGNWQPKIWSINNFNKLIHLLNKKFFNLKFVIVGSFKEKEIYFENIKKDLPNDLFVDLMGKSLAYTSAYMKKSNLFIGNDSGLMHLSIASKLKTIALFGPTNDKIYGHQNLNSFVVRTKERYEDFDINTIDFNNSYMHSISPKKIMDIIIDNKLL